MVCLIHGPFSARRRKENMKEKFCGECGARLDEATGLCPKCDAEKLRRWNEWLDQPKWKEQPEAPKQRERAPAGRREEKRRRSGKKETTAQKKARKREQRAQWSTGKKVRRFLLKLLGILLALAVLAAAGVCALVYFGIVDIPMVDRLLEDVGLKNGGNVINYENGDRTYTPKEEDISYDERENVIYFNNQLIVYTFSELSEAEKKQLEKCVDGKIVGDINGIINVLQIQVEKSSLAEIELMASRLMDMETVIYAGYDYPMQPVSTAADSNPWTENREQPEADRGNEITPSGNDWWAEAIGAYTAWQYSDKTTPIKIGIIDSGFDTDHPDLAENITFLPEYDTNVEDDHGTQVAGVIGAINNDIGMRGIADSATMVCVDRTPTESVNYISSGEYVEIIKQLIEADVKVINNSWGNVFLSKDKYMLSVYWDMNAKGKFEEITSQNIRLKNNKNGIDTYEFIDDSRDNVQFFINQSKVTYEKFIKNVKKGCNIRLVTENSKVKEVYYIKKDYGYFREKIAVTITGAYSSYVDFSEAFSKRTGLECVVMMAELLMNGKEDFLIVQSAGNGYDNYLDTDGVDAHYTGYFCAVDNDVFNLLSDKARTHLAQEGIDYRSIKDRILIVGAVKNSRDKNGDYEMTLFSSFGPNVDICAPGEEVFSTTVNNAYEAGSGTSMSAPIVAGSAAFIWSLDPELSAPKVRDILLRSAVSQAKMGNTYKYPMLNVGAAASEVIKEINARTPRVPVDAVEFDGHYYYLFDTDSVTTWNEAKDYCESLGGYLAAITSQVENDFLYDYIYHHGYESAYFGLTDAGSEGTWSWCNGEPVSYVHWASGEPNNEGGENYGMFYWKYPDATWNDGDFGSGTQNGGKAFICEWGEYTTAQEPERTTSGERDIVLVLDVSGSMAGSPMEETKKASVKFIDTILDEDASIGIVTYDDSASMQADFSADKAALEATVSGIYDGGSTNIEAGLAEAEAMLRTSGARKKIIVLMSDGEPNAGKEGDELIAYADSLKEKGIIIYTLGFFESLGGYKSYAQTLMEGIASDGCHYEVASADDLVFFFEDMADQINGQKYIYIRIACPVDVTVAYNGEILSSEEDRLNVRTEFGTLTFEEREDGSSADAEDRIKVLRLKEGAEYDVRINGTGRGLMDYTIGFMDENGEYSDFRRFEKVKITRKTKIDTVAAVSETSVLNIDEDGDGRYDLKLRAEENGYGEEVDNSLLIYAAIGGGALLLVVVLVLVVRGNRKKRKTER